MRPDGALVLPRGPAGEGGRLKLVPCLAILAFSAPAAAQPVFRCAGDGGSVTYQETPCPGTAAQRRLDTGPGPGRQDELAARRALERDGYRGSELSRRFAGEAREREREYLLKEMQAREERARRAHEESLRRPPEDVPWNPPWGFPGRPGQALQKNRPAPGS